MPKKLAAIMFTDVVGSSSKMGSDEARTISLLNQHFDIMRPVISQYHGKTLKKLGDGLLAYFDSAADAVSCGIAVQQSMRRKNLRTHPSNVLQHRIGIHLGDIYVDDREVMGDGVNIASRLQAEAEPGGLCISQTVYDVVKGKLRIEAVPLGPRKLKNIKHDIPVYQINFDTRQEISSRIDSGGTDVHGEFEGGLGMFKWLCFLETAALFVAVFQMKTSFISSFFHKPASQTGVRFLEGIFATPAARLSLLVTLMLMAFLLSLELSKRIANVITGKFLHNFLLYPARKF